MKLVVLLGCGACGSFARLLVEPDICCHGHAHVSDRDPRLPAWYSSHHIPAMMVEGHIEEAT